MYFENSDNPTQAVVQASEQKSASTQGRDSQIKPGNEGGSGATKLTTSRVLEQIKWFESL